MRFRPGAPGPIQAVQKSLHAGRVAQFGEALHGIKRQGVEQFERRNAVGGGVEDVVGGLLEEPGLGILQAAQHFHPGGALGRVLGKMVNGVKQVGRIGAAVRVDPQVAVALEGGLRGELSGDGPLLPVPAPVRAGLAQGMGREDRLDGVHKGLDIVCHQCLQKLSVFYYTPDGKSRK